MAEPHPSFFQCHGRILWCVAIDKRPHRPKHGHQCFLSSFFSFPKFSHPRHYSPGVQWPIAALGGMAGHYPYQPFSKMAVGPSHYFRRLDRHPSDPVAANHRSSCYLFQHRPCLARMQHLVAKAQPKNGARIIKKATLSDGLYQQAIVISLRHLHSRHGYFFKSLLYVPNNVFVVFDTDTQTDHFG
jgi:hypothetical protein